jgi:hypothetical protein
MHDSGFLHRTLGAPMASAPGPRTRAERRQAVRAAYRRGVALRAERPGPGRANVRAYGRMTAAVRSGLLRRLDALGHATDGRYTPPKAKRA